VLARPCRASLSPPWLVDALLRSFLGSTLDRRARPQEGVVTCGNRFAGFIQYNLGRGLCRRTECFAYNRAMTPKNNPPPPMAGWPPTCLPRRRARPGYPRKKQPVEPEGAKIFGLSLVGSRAEFQKWLKINNFRKSEGAPCGRSSYTIQRPELRA